MSEPEKKQSKLGSELKKARKDKQITLEEISHKSRIKIDYLKAMEKDEFDFLNKPYIIAFIKSFSRMVGLDPDISLQKYSEQCNVSIKDSIANNHGSYGSGHDSSKTRGGDKEFKDRAQQYKKGFTFTLVIVAAIIILIFLQKIFNNSDNGEIVVPNRQVETVGSAPDSTR